MNIGGVVETVLEDFLVGVDKSRLLLELAFQILECMVKFLIEHEEAHAEGKHVLAPYDGFHVQAAVLQAFFRQSGNRRHDDIPVTYAQLLNGIHGDKHVAEISRGIDLDRTYVHLKTGHT